MALYQHSSLKSSRLKAAVNTARIQGRRFKAPIGYHNDTITLE